MSAYSTLILSETSLVAYFRLGETVGSTTVTDSKASNTAASTGSSTTLGVTGILPSDTPATGASFTGTGVFTGSAGLQTALNFERTNAFSIEAWVKPNVGRGSGVQTQVILDHRSSASSNQGYILFMAWNSGSSQTRIQFQLNNNISGGANSLAMETTSIDMTNGTIYHVVFTYDGSSTPGGCKVYVNGVAQTLGTDYNTLSSSIQTTQVPLIGNVTGGGSLPWQGTLQELAVYNAVLTQSQITSHCQSGIGVIDGVASVSGFIGGGTTATVTLSTTKANDIIVVCAYTEGGVSGSAPALVSIMAPGLTFFPRADILDTGANHNSRLSVWWAYSPAILTSKVITVTWSGGSDDYALVAFGANGCNTSAPWDTNSSLPAAQSNAGNSPSAAYSTTLSSDLSLAIMGKILNNAAGDLASPPTGYIAVGGSSTNAGQLDAECVVACQAIPNPQTGVTVSWGSYPALLILDALTANVPSVTGNPAALLAHF